MDYKNFKSPRSSPKSSKPLFKLFIFLISAVITALLLFKDPVLPVETMNEPSAENSVPNSPAQADDSGNISLNNTPIVLPETKVDELLPPTPESELQEQRIVIKSGENLAIIFKRLALNYQTLHKILKLGLQAKPLLDLRPHHELLLTLNKQNELVKLVYQLNDIENLVVIKKNQSFNVIKQKLELTKRTRYVTTTIKNSLFGTGKRAHIPDKLLTEFVHNMSWDIDFAKDIRSGDRITLIYEESWLKDKKIRTGHLLAAAFTNHGKTHKIIRFTDPQGNTGYYTPEGYSVRKAFLRAPVHYTRISSLFQSARLHPILHRFRRHQGVDYAAPRGTPIHATANGIVIFRGRKGGYGNAIILRHGNKYSTLYGHLSRFEAHIKSGIRVKQSQVIGYVGSTGLASGPHVHYEIRIHNKQYDPLKIKLPFADPIARNYRKTFNLIAKKLLAQLDGQSTTA